MKLEIDFPDTNHGKAMSDVIQKIAEEMKQKVGSDNSMFDRFDLEFDVNILVFCMVDKFNTKSVQVIKL